MSSNEASVLVSTIEGIERRRAQMEREVDLAIDEVAREEAANRKLIEEGHRRLIALRAVRREQEERKQVISAEIANLEMAALKDGLTRDRTRFMERVGMARVAAETRDQQLEEELADPALGPSLTEFENYQDVEPTLNTMPAAIRKSIQEKHERLTRKLARFIEAANAGPPPLAAAPLGVGLVAAADPAEGAPQALVVVLPVPYAVYSEWTDRPEDLATLLTYRLIAALFRLVRLVGAPDAPVQYEQVHGNLAVQVWLGDHTVEGDLREHTLELIAAAYEDAAELWAAGVELYTVWVRPELLVPEEGV